MLVLHNSIPMDDLQVIVYRDDSLYYKFYALPNSPRIRKDVDGDPVFLLTKYAFSDQDRENNPDLPTGGGFVNLDTVLAMTPEQSDAVQTKLQTFVEDEYNRRRGIDPNAEDYTYKGPKAELGSPQWVDGKVKFHVANDPNLVKGKLCEGKPSMFGSNNAIFNATLTPAGATYFQKTLVNEDGSGIDLTPIQVEYELSFMRRLPPARMLVTGSITEVYHAVSELDHDYDDNFWSEDDFTTKESYVENLYKSETIRINIDTGEYEADSDEIEELRSFAMGQVTTWLQDNLFERITKHDPTYPDIADVYNKEADVYRLKTIDQVTDNRLYINIQQTGLVPFTIHPQATLESFFSGMTEEQISAHVRTVDLEDSFFTTLDLDVKAFADFSEVAYVKVDLQYDGEDGLKTQSFSFESDDAKTCNWNPRLNNGNREYRWRYEVAYKSDPSTTIVTNYEPETTRQLNINVGRPGELSVEVLAGQIDWEQVVEQVQIHLSYEDRSNDIDFEETVLILKKDTPSTGYKRWLYKMQEQPVKWTAKYFLKNGQEFEASPETTKGDQIVINDEFVDTLDVLVVPSGKIEYINQVIVDLRYKDRSGYSSIKHLAIAKANFLGAWKIPLIDSGDKKWEWKKLVLFKDGTSEESSWVTLEGSQALPVSWTSPPSLNITITPALVKFQQAPVVEVTLTYKGDIVDGASPETFIFEDNKKQTWNILVEDDSKDEYDWEITYYTDPDPVTLTGTSNKSKLLIPRIPVG